MKARPNERQKRAPQPDPLADRLEAAKADSARIAAKRLDTERRLAELGEQVAGLARDLEEINERNAAERLQHDT